MESYVLFNMSYRSHHQTLPNVSQTWAFIKLLQFNPTTKYKIWALWSHLFQLNDRVHLNFDHPKNKNWHQTWGFVKPTSPKPITQTLKTIFCYTPCILMFILACICVHLVTHHQTPPNLKADTSMCIYTNKFTFVAEQEISFPVQSLRFSKHKYSYPSVRS